MFAMPTCGSLRGSPRLPVAQPSTAGGADAQRDLVARAFDALQHFERAVVLWSDGVDALELFADAELLADELQRDASAAAGRLPSAEEQQA